jgi:hypothetical protein
MPIYACECCNYETQKKSSYDNHNKSIKHQKNLQNKNKPEPKPEPIQPIVELIVHELPKPIEEPKPQSLKRTTKEKLDNDFKDTICFENLFHLLSLEEYNNFIQVVNFEDEEKIILACNKIKKGEYDVVQSTIACELIRNLILSLNGNIPFYCADKRRNILYMKTINGWIKETDDKIEFDDLILKFGLNVLNIIQRAVATTSIIFKKNKNQFIDIYNIHYDLWFKDNFMEIIGSISYIGDNDIETTEIKKKLINRIKLLFCELSKHFDD